MLRLGALRNASKKEKSPVFGGIGRPMSMNDRRLARPPGNPIRKYPHYGAHRWDASKKYMCIDFRHPDQTSSLAQFVLRYTPSQETTEAADLLVRALQTLLPGAKVAREPSLAQTNFRLTRLDDLRVIAEAQAQTQSQTQSQALVCLDNVDALKDKATLARLVNAARFW